MSNSEAEAIWSDAMRPFSIFPMRLAAAGTGTGSPAASSGRLVFVPDDSAPPTKKLRIDACDGEVKSQKESSIVASASGSPRSASLPGDLSLRGQ